VNDPTAVQAAAAQETPSSDRSAADRPRPSGPTAAEASVFHAVPSQRSISASVRPAPGLDSTARPTAVHALGAKQETLFSRSSVPGRSGVRSIDQSVPSQRSASGVWDPVGLHTAPAHDPTAVHAAAEAHDTAVRSLVPPAPGAGVLCTVQVLPSHSAATGRPAFEPTATHAIVEGHDTPSSSPPGSLASACTTQAAPSQRAIAGAVPVPKSAYPTATQSAGDGHDTLRSCPCSRGDVCTTQRRPSHRSAIVIGPAC
jgi:hypothetical protein